MALVWYDADINGKIGNPKEGETTKIDFFFTELFIKKDEEKKLIHMHFWVSEAQKELFCYKGKQGTATIPGRIYYLLDGNSKELGVQCAYQAVALLDEGTCYKGKFSIDGALGSAQSLLDKPEMLAMMKEMFIAAEVVPAVNLKPEDCGEVAQKAKGSWGGSKGETKSEQIAARRTAFTALCSDADGMDALRLELSLFLNATPTNGDLMALLNTLLS